MNMDRDKKTGNNLGRLWCNIIRQEMTTIDIALFSRLVYLTFTKTEFSNEEKRAFDDCKKCTGYGLVTFDFAVTSPPGKMETDFTANYRQCMTDLNDCLSKEKDRRPYSAELGNTFGGIPHDGSSD